MKDEPQRHQHSHRTSWVKSALSHAEHLLCCLKLKNMSFEKILCARVYIYTHTFV